MTEWETQRLGDLVKKGVLAISDGYRMRNEELGATGIPFVRGGDIGDGWINTTTEDHIRPEFVDRVKAKLARPGDVAFITKGTVGRAGRLRAGQPEVVFAPQVAYWRSLDVDVLDSRFLFYLIRGRQFQAALDGVKTHGAMVADYVSISQQHDFSFRLPGIKTQRQIGLILGSLDDKIELNRRINATLEAMARALFKDWFIDFGPVRAKMEGRQPPGLSLEIAALFPDKLDEEGKPRDWSKTFLSDLIELNPDEPLKKGAMAPYLDMASLPTVGSWPDPPFSRAFGSGMRFRNGDTLLARITPCLENGKTALVQRLNNDEVGWGSTEYIVMRGKGFVPDAYCYLLARDREFRAHAMRSMSGTSGRQRVQADAVAQYQLYDPPIQIWNAFSEAVTPWFEAIRNRSEEAETLAQVRDILLPKLLSGEISTNETPTSGGTE